MKYPCFNCGALHEIDDILENSEVFQRVGLRVLSCTFCFGRNLDSIKFSDESIEMLMEVVMLADETRSNEETIREDMMALMSKLEGRKSI